MVIAVTAYEAVLVGVDEPCVWVAAAAIENLQGTAWRSLRIVAKGDRLADELGADLVDAAIEADGAIVMDLALGLEQTEVTSAAA